MKRILLIFVILAAMLLSACGAPATTPEPTNTPTPTPTPDETIITPTPTPTYTLSVSVSPPEAGSVSPPGGKYDSGLQVTLTATPASGNTFDYWDGAASGSSPTVTITMNSNKSTTAHFKVVETTEAPTPPLTPTLSPGYSRSNPVGIGIALTTKVTGTGAAAGKYADIFGEYEVRLTLLETIRGTEAWQRIEAANMFNDPPKAGFEYILARIRFDYLSGSTPDKTFDISPVWFAVISGEGKEYEYESVSGLDPEIRTSLYPAASHEGWIAYLVAVDDTKPLMTLGRETDGTGGIWFKLY